MSDSLTLHALGQALIIGLRQIEVEAPELEARWIIEHVTGLTRSEQILSEASFVSAAQKSEAISCLERRKAGMPLDMIFGYKEFYGLRFDINANVLSPRPETEMLVNFVLNHTTANQNFRFLDLGTGSGAIAISILTHRPNARAVAVDISEKALKIARENAVFHKVSDRLSFVRGSWASAVSGTFDFILSNPPYIDSKAMTALDLEVCRHDPEISLHGGEDGLDAYRLILPQIQPILKPLARVAVEIGYDQGDSVSSMFSENGFTDIGVFQDLSGNDRVVAGIATN